MNFINGIINKFFQCATSPYAKTRPPVGMRHPQYCQRTAESLTWKADEYPPGVERERCWRLAEKIAAKHELTVDDTIGQRDSVL